MVAPLEAVLGAPVGVDDFLRRRVGRCGLLDGYRVHRGGREWLAAPEDDAEGDYQRT
jgi:hypothetical protein